MGCDLVTVGNGYFQRAFKNLPQKHGLTRAGLAPRHGGQRECDGQSTPFGAGRHLHLSAVALCHRTHDCQAQPGAGQDTDAAAKKKLTHTRQYFGWQAGAIVDEAELETGAAIDGDL